MAFYLILCLIPLITSLLLGNPIINLLKSLSAKQTIREDGPPDHIKRKSQTPTIGGLIFLIPVFAITLSILIIKKDFQFQTLDLAVVLLATLVMAVLGFIDDYLKVVKKHNKGVSGWIKLFIQFLISLGICFLYKEGNVLFYLIWVFFIFSGSSNSYNLTDGLDGLLGSISIVSLIGFSFLFHNYNKPELLLISIVSIGSLTGFLYFNKHPAKVFMGDTGSLAIGALVGSLAIVTKTELYLICFATIPILEALSVILQVVSCQLSKKFLGVDKRIFKMAPLHHHFELVGWKETDIVKRFFIFQVICMLIGVLILVFAVSPHRPIAGSF